MIHYRLQGNGTDGFALDAEIYTNTYNEAMAICRALVSINYVTEASLVNPETFAIDYVCDNESSTIKIHSTGKLCK